MSCYIRHMKEFLGEIGINSGSKEERKEVDLAVRRAIGRDASDRCNEVWREVKVWLQDEDKNRELALKLEEEFS